MGVIDPVTNYPLLSCCNCQIIYQLLVQWRYLRAHAVSELVNSVKWASPPDGAMDRTNRNKK